MIFEMLNELEVLEIAKGIEEGGYAFYNNAASNAKDESRKKIFEYMAAEELEHIKTFERIHQRVVETLGKDAPYIYEEEVSAYLRAIWDTAVFNVKGITLNNMTEIHDAKEALLIGLQAEKDSILFYETVQAHTREELTKKVLSRLIKEEVKHLHDLKNLLEQV